MPLMHVWINGEPAANNQPHDVILVCGIDLSSVESICRLLKRYIVCWIDMSSVESIYRLLDFTCRLFDRLIVCWTICNMLWWYSDTQTNNKHKRPQTFLADLDTGGSRQSRADIIIKAARGLVMYTGQWTIYAFSNLFLYGNCRKQIHVYTNWPAREMRTDYQF